MSSFTIKPNPLYLIKNGVITPPSSSITTVFDLKNYNVPPISLCHLEVLTTSYKLNGLNKNNPPVYDPDIATQAEILLEELNFQNHYNVDTGHAVRLDLYSRESSDDEWNIETSRLIYRTGLFITSLDTLYPDLVNTNVWICNPTTELGASITVSPQVSLKNDDFLFLKTGLVIKSDFEPLITYNSPTTYTVNTTPQAINIEPERRKISIHTPTSNPSSVFLRFGGQAGLGVGQYHIELPPGYNNPSFEIISRQTISVISSQPACQLVVG